MSLAAPLHRRTARALRVRDGHEALRDLRPVCRLCPPGGRRRVVVWTHDDQSPAVAARRRPRRRLPTRASPRTTATCSASSASWPAAGGFVDLSHRGVVTVTGADRLAWLHLLLTQHVSELPAGPGHRGADPVPARPHRARALPGGRRHDDLDPRRARHPGRAAGVPGEHEVLLPGRDRRRDRATTRSSTCPPDRSPRCRTAGRCARRRTGPGRLRAPRRAGGVRSARRARRSACWPYEALRIEAHRPRLGLETDHRTIPHELGWLEDARSTCRRAATAGQETVARVHNLGRPPRRLVFLHLDGSEVQLPRARHAESGCPPRARRAASSA